MITKRISKKLTVKLYESMDEMPMDLYFLCSQYVLMQFEIGSSPDDINKRFNSLDVFLVNKQWDDAIQERNNMHQTFYNIQQGINFPSLVFGTYIHSVNDKKVEDYSESNLMEIMRTMGKAGFTFKTMEELTESLKKKMNHELLLLFPTKYNNISKENYFDQLRQKTIAELSYIIEPKPEYIQIIRNVVDYILLLMKPKNINWSDSNNVIVEAKRSYEKLCSMLMQGGFQNPGQLSVIKFHIAVETYESKFKRRTQPI